MTTLPVTFNIEREMRPIDIVVFDALKGYEVNGTGLPVIVREAGTTNVFIGILCGFNSGQAMLFVADKPLHFISAWRGVRMLKRLEWMRLCGSIPVTLNSLTAALTGKRKTGLMSGLSEDFGMPFDDFVDFKQNWGRCWLSPRELMELDM